MHFRHLVSHPIPYGYASGPRRLANAGRALLISSIALAVCSITAGLVAAQPLSGLIVGAATGAMCATSGTLLLVAGHRAARRTYRQHAAPPVGASTER